MVFTSPEQRLATEQLVRDVWGGPIPTWGHKPHINVENGCWGVLRADGKHRRVRNFGDACKLAYLWWETHA